MFEKKSVKIEELDAILATNLEEEKLWKKRFNKRQGLKLTILLKNLMNVQGHGLIFSSNVIDPTKRLKVMKKLNSKMNWVTQ